MGQKIAGVFTGLIAGYLLGMAIGFTLFNPDQDVWALLGVVLAVVGMGIGLTPFFRRNTAVMLTALIGFYFGTLLGTVFFGNIAQDDLLEVLQRPTLFFSIGGTVLGGLIGRRLPAEKVSLPLLTFLLGGFLGGYVLGVVCHLAPYPSFVGWSPFVVGSGLVVGGLAALLKRRLRKDG
jgi:hypothetical protein